MTEPRRLYRDFENGMVGGVCAGIAEYAGMDATVVRILAVVVAIVTAVVPTVLVYLAMWALVPRKPTQPPASVAPPLQQS